jgi:uncharacterized protein YaaR (DUF327 family)
VKVKSARESLKCIEGEYPAISKTDSKVSKVSFRSQFDTMGREQYENYVSDLAQRINEQGKKLSQKADVGEMERYRSLISELLNEVVSNAYAFQRENSFDFRGRHKVFATIQKINEKLDELAGEIISGNKGTINIISKVDDIRGLIIDILM